MSPGTDSRSSRPEARVDALGVGRRTAPVEDVARRARLAVERRAEPVAGVRGRRRRDPVLGEEAVTHLEATSLVGRQVRGGERQRVARQGVAGGVAAEVGVRPGGVAAPARDDHQAATRTSAGRWRRSRPARACAGTPGGMVTRPRSSRRGRRRRQRCGPPAPPTPRCRRARSPGRDRRRARRRRGGRRTVPGSPPARRPPPSTDSLKAPAASSSAASKSAISPGPSSARVLAGDDHADAQLVGEQVVRGVVGEAGVLVLL